MWFEIIGANAAPGNCDLILDGDQRKYFSAGFRIRVRGKNAGKYTISEVVYSSGQDSTSLLTQEDIIEAGGGGTLRKSKRHHQE